MEIYAAYQKQVDILRESSSGGIFFAAAEYVIGKNGYVVASVYDSQSSSLNFAICNTLEQVKQCRGSKYIQSNPGNIFKRIPDLIATKHPLLICGTPCQIAGIKSYLSALHVSTDSVYYIDLFCHGVPSPGLWKKYVELIENEIKEKSLGVDFKDKRNGWLLPFAYLDFSSQERDIREYDRLYYKEVISRPSCYECPFSTFDREGDLSIGDFWKVKERMPKMYNQLGVSNILVNTNKGKVLFNNISETLVYERCSREDVLQQCLMKPVEKTKDRELFWKTIQSIGFEKTFKLYTTVPFKDRVMSKIKRTIGLQK